VLVARRLPLLEEIGHTLTDEYSIGYRAMALDLSQEDFLGRLETIAISGWSFPMLARLPQANF
jgi:short-subunit dehydrogenase